MCFGGDQGAGQLQNTASTLAGQESARRERAFNALFPYASARMTSGLPEISNIKDLSEGALARNTGLARNQTLRSLAGAGINPNDPSSLQIMADFDADRARSFDDLLLQIINAQNNAKESGARLMAGVASGSDPFAALNLATQLALR